MSSAILANQIEPTIQLVTPRGRYVHSGVIDNHAVCDYCERHEVLLLVI